MNHCPATENGRTGAPQPLKRSDQAWPQETQLAGSLLPLNQEVWREASVRPAWKQYVIHRMTRWKAWRRPAWLVLPALLLHIMILTRGLTWFSHSYPC